MNSDLLQQLFREKQIKTHLNQGITIALVRDQEQGFAVAKEVLYKIIDKRSVLFLSGGRTPKELYKMLTTEEKIKPGAVGLVDERFGKPMHGNSNEKMLQDTGFLRYLHMRDIQFHSILNPNTPHARLTRISDDSLREEDSKRVQVADLYDQKMRELFALYQEHVAILGVGLDGHTAGIAGNRSDFSNPLFLSSQKELVVSEFNDPKGMYKERITMTFLGLSMMDFLLVLIFGADKEKALEKMFSGGSEEEIPSRFLKRPLIAAKTLLLTDQQV